MIFLWVLFGLIVAIFTPMILGWVVGLVWGGLTKLGIAGKIIATLLMVVIGGMLGFVPLAIASIFSIFNTTLFVAMVVGSALLIPTWYFFWHHDVVKEMGIVGFSVNIKFLFMWVWYGGGIGMIVAAFKNTVGAYIAVGSFVAGIIFYVLATKAFAEDVDRDESSSFKFRWIGMAVAVGLTAAITIIAGTAEKTEKANIEAGITFAATTKKQKELAAQYPAGTVVISDTDSYSLYAEPTEKSPTIRALKNGEKFTTTGEVRFDTKWRASTTETWLQVHDNGATSWVNLSNLATPIGTATVISNNAVFVPMHGSNNEIPLKKGETVDVLLIFGDDYKEAFYRGKTSLYYQGQYGRVETKDLKMNN